MPGVFARASAFFSMRQASFLPSLSERNASVYTLRMREPRGPIQEAKRVFLWTLLIRLAFWALVIMLRFGFWSTLPRSGPFSYLAEPGPFFTRVLLQMSVALLLTGLALAPWMEKLLGKYELAILLTADVLQTSLQSMPKLEALELEQSSLVESLPAVVIEPFLFTLIPLVLMAWAYGRRGALWGGMLAMALHTFSTMQAYYLGQLQGGFWVAMVMRIVLLFSIPLVVSILADRERQRLKELAAAHIRLRRHAATVEQLAISRERNRLARDLHDTLAHSFAALTVQLEALKTLLDHDPSAARQAIDEAISLARDGLQESRQAIQALRTDRVASLGLVGALRGELQELGARTGLHTSLDLEGPEPELTEEEAQALFRIVQEALTNVERHAQAQTVRVRLRTDIEALRLTVQDDGQGFDPHHVAPGHYGLAGMRERAELIGAQLEIQSRIGQGTVVRVLLPR